ncbi:hypothetical protein EJ05DRAFT_495431 [Pseudovirgaria hyperparasitica]|uniref:Uncharacterized protein n=1 Tax=Pseudovirgaria hyperparasitica TaxID=470096 RepID=A0A6A6WK67_9PEZI|nr:uncharacterized protein EJ05DRAFT_495431 [Pseudovirgaria hyperparasitica]KAF2762551.1 hypothetical protein EJ05DRAFT_495431 [Pseudovirgaria hyperparasitica]
MSPHNKTTLTHPTPSHANPILTSKLQDTLYTALINAGSVPHIQRSLTQELSASGWTANLRVQIMQLLRSGECTTFNQLMERIMKDARGETTEKNATNGATNGDLASKEVEEGGLKIPDRAVQAGIKVVKTELEKACNLKFDDEG